jgi:membrane-associated phospholipid phosphatase
VRRPAPLAGDRRLIAPLAGAAICAVGLAAVGVLAFHGAHDRDAAMLHGLTGLYGSRVDTEIRTTARLADPMPYALLGTACIAVALVRRRPARACAVGVLLVGTGVTTHALKHLLAEPRYADWLGFRDQIEAVSWPSGHGTAAMTLALCAVLVAPPAWRAGVALVGLAGTVALAFATLALAWHYPSDVFAGFLIAGLWVALAIAVLRRVEAGPPEPARPPGFWWLVGLGAAGALGAAAAAGAAAQRITLYPAERTTTVIGSLALSALAVVIVAGTVALASTPGDGPGGPSRPKPEPDVTAGQARSARGASSRRGRVRA